LLDSLLQEKNNMALLLDKILSDPETFGDITKDMRSTSPPPGLDAEAWQFKEELPLHIINYLRDATSKILSNSASKQTPSKGKRPVKYNYNSPVKSVSKEKPKKPRKEKKKVKLFPVGKSISEEDGFEGDISMIEGVGELPPTPLRFKQKPQEPRKKPIPSPQPLSLADFIKPESAGKKKTVSRSPKKSKSRIKSSTPNPESFVSRLGRLGEEEGQKNVVNKLDLSSKDLFPEIGEGETKKRRIKPISLTSQPSTSQPGFGTISQRPGLTTCFSVEEVEKDTVDDRMMMKEAAALTPFKGSLAQSKTPNKVALRPVTSAPLIVPSPASVTGTLQLDVLVALYSYTILNNLMPNLNVELYFIIELLQVETGESEVDSESLLASVHNCVYFSVRVLEHIVSYLQFLDRSSMKLLMENSRISVFSDSLRPRLQEVCERSVVSSPPQKLKSSGGLQNVSFQTETDNRINFPSDSSFHDFKKQRDKFYALIRSWGENPRGKDYHFSQAFGLQVDDLLRMHHHTVNYSHFCTLFLQQLLAMCRGEQPSYSVNPMNLARDELSNLKGLDPLKYARLAARLVTPGQLGGPCPPPSFMGAQEFFRDFILHCKNPRFLVHLKNIIIAEILKGVDVYFGVEEQSLLMKSDVSRLSETSMNEDTSGLGSTDSDMNHLVQQTVLTLRLSGKFLGLLEFAPYIFSDRQTEGNFQLDDPVFLIRKNSSPPLEIRQMLHRAEVEGRLVVVVPWILEFMSQMDEMSHHIDYYKDLSLMLIKLYQNTLRPGSLNASPSVAFFLSAYIGWLLEKEEFPRDLIILARFENHHLTNLEDSAIDTSFSVPQSLVYQCCPWLSEIKVLLTSTGQPNSLPSLDKENYRKITPISAPKPSHRDQEENIQKELEENFLTNHPSSLRRTTEFVAERLASNNIKFIRNKLVPAERARIFETLRIKYKTITDKELDSWGLECANNVFKDIRHILSTQGRKDAESTLDLLISDDINPAAKGVCVGLTVRNIMEKVEQWSKQNITQTFFCNEFVGERDRIIKAEGRDKGIDTGGVFLSHDPSAPSPSSLLIRLKQETLRNMVPAENPTNDAQVNERFELTDSTLERTSVPVNVTSTCDTTQPLQPVMEEGKHRISSPNLEAVPDSGLDLLDRVERCIRHRSDLTPVGAQGLGSVSVDWILSRIAAQPHAVSDKLIQKILSIWKLLCPVQLVNILAPASLMILEHSQQKQLTWDRMRQLLCGLLRENLVPVLALEDTCIQLVQQDWCDVTLGLVGGCLEDLRAEGGWDGALDWVPWFNKQNENDSRNKQ